MNIDFFSKLPAWSAQDPANQVFWVNRLKELLQNLDDEINELLVETVLLEQATYPLQGDWETAYTTQTGNSLPIPPSTNLFWWDTTNNIFGGIFGTLPNSGGIVYAKDNKYAPGQIVAYSSAYRNDANNITSSINSFLSLQPSLILNVPVLSRIKLYFGLMTDLTASAGVWGVDFLFDNVKVGTEYYGIASAGGIATANADGFVQVTAEIPEVPAGNYTVQALFGVVSGTPTVAIGGDRGVRLLIAEAISL